MAIAVIGGLVLSTMLSLLVAPAFYVIADRVFKKKRIPVEECAIAAAATEQPAPSER